MTDYPNVVNVPIAGSARFEQDTAMAISRLKSALGPVGRPTFATISLSELTADRLVYSDVDDLLQSATLGSSLTFTAPTLNTIQGIRTVDSPEFAGLTISAGGTVGVGLAGAPSEMLHVSGVIRSDNAFNIAGDLGASDSAAGIPLTLTANGGLVTAITKSTVTEFSTDGTMADNSDLAVPTEKAVVTYVSAAVSAEDYWDRAGTTVSLHNAGDLVTLSGNLSITGTQTYGLDTSAGTWTGDINLRTIPAVYAGGVRVCKLDTTSGNCFLGINAGVTRDGTTNTFIGDESGKFADNTGAGGDSPGNRNVYVGHSSGRGLSALVPNCGSENVAIGDEALLNNTSGYENTAIGDEALKTNTTGYDNVAIGNDALEYNTTGHNNVAVGIDAMYNNQGGDYNVAVGHQPLYNSSAGEYNVAVGYQALYSSTSSSYNTAVGYQALYNATTAANHVVAIGYRAGYGATSFDYNVFIGDETGNLNGGENNLFIGYRAGYRNSTVGTGLEGDYNIYIGYRAGYGAASGGNTGLFNVGIGANTFESNSSGQGNVAIGYGALRHNTTGGANFALGLFSLVTNTTGNYNLALGTNTLATCNGNGNIAIGYGALYSGSTKEYDTAIGYKAGYNSTTGDRNVYIGAFAGYNQTTLSDILIIDNKDRTSIALELTNSLIYGVFNAAPASQTLRLNAAVTIPHGLNLDEYLDVDITNTVAAGKNCLYLDAVQGTNALTGTLRGIYSVVTNGNFVSTGTIRAIEGKARAALPDLTGGNITTLEGMSLSADAKNKTVTTLRGAEIILDGQSGASVTTAVGVRIANNFQANLATTSYGLQIYRDSFDYTADIQLSSGGMIGGSSGHVNIDSAGKVTIPNDLAVDTNVLYVDTANNRVGINVTAPERELDIFGVLGMQMTRASANTSASTVVLRKSRAGTDAIANGDFSGVVDARGWDGDSWIPTCYFGGKVDGAVSDQNVPQAFIVATGTAATASERIRVTSAGLVLVNKTSGTEQLEVNGKIRADTAFNVNGTDGLTSTLTLDDGANWRITMTFTGGILTAKTTAASSGATATWS